MFKKFLNTFFFGYLTKFKRLVYGLSIATIGLSSFVMIGEVVTCNWSDGEAALLLFSFTLLNSFASYVLQPFSKNPNNEKWIVLTWAVVMLIFGVIMGQIL